MTEIWRDIEGYEGKYEVSNLGRIKSLKRKGRREEQILESYLDLKGYPMIQVCKNGKKHPTKIHRLVAEAFIVNFNNKPQVNHIDGNKSNNIVINLEWCSCSENIIHAFKMGLYKSRKGEQSGHHKLSEKEAKEIKNLKGKGLSQKVIGKMFNISNSTVGRIHNNKCW